MPESASSRASIVTSRHGAWRNVPLLFAGGWTRRRRARGVQNANIESFNGRWRDECLTVRHVSFRTLRP
jgi:hypothetical protein